MRLMTAVRSEPETRALFRGGFFLSLVGDSPPLVVSMPAFSDVFFRFGGMLSEIRQGTTILFFLVNLKYNLSERSMKTLPSVTQEQAQGTNDD